MMDANNATAGVAQAVVRLMNDRELAQRLGTAGRALVEDRYSWASIVQTMEQFHLRVAQEKQRSLNSA